MPELTTRPLTTDDDATLADLYNAAEAAAGGDPLMTTQTVRIDLETWVKDLTTDTRGVFTDDGTAVAMGWAIAPPAGGFRLDITGAVHPEFRGRGLGRDMISWQFARAAEMHTAHLAAHLTADAAGPDWTLETGLNAADESAIALLTHAGMAPARYWFEMRAETAAVPAIAMPSGFRVTPYEPSGAAERALYEAHTEAFAGHYGFQVHPFEEWAPSHTANPELRPELSRIAYADGEIAGYVIGYDGPDGNLYIGQVGTRAPWRGKGLAAALLAEVLTAAGEAGIGNADLTVDAANATGAVGLYERVGFTQTALGVTYRRSLAASVADIATAGATAGASL